MLGEQTEYTRQSGFDDIQQEQMVLKFVAQHGSMKRPDVVRLCQLSDDQATRLLQKMVREGRLQAHGLRRWTRYSLPGG
jgi:ATP-dependent DNA helicase RecG